MPRPKTHKIAVQTKGLTHEEAARLHYLVSCAARAFTTEYETSGNVPLTILRKLFKDDEWYSAKRQDRIDLMT